jgi:hypothetical protein
MRLIIVWKLQEAVSNLSAAVEKEADMSSQDVVMHEVWVFGGSLGRKEGL